MTKLSEATLECNTQANSEMGIVVGPHRMRAATWEDAIGLVRNGAGYVRDGGDLRHITSDAYENGLWRSRMNGRIGH